MIYKIKQFFCRHEFKTVSFEKTGEITCDWALNLRPERRYVRKCEKCEFETAELCITLADPIIKR